MSVEDGSYRYSKKQIAEIFRTSVSGLNNWIDNGCPVVGRKGNKYQLDLRDVITWRIDYIRGDAGAESVDELSYQQSRAKRERARAETAEIELALLKGDIASVSDVASKWQQVAVALRTKLLSLPTKLAAKLGACKTVIDRQAVIKKAITGALIELSDDTPGIPKRGTTGLNKSDKRTTKGILGKNAPATRSTGKRVGRPKKDTKSRK